MSQAGCKNGGAILFGIAGINQYSLHIRNGLSAEHVAGLPVANYLRKQTTRADATR